MTSEFCGRSRGATGCVEYFVLRYQIIVVRAPKTNNAISSTLARGLMLISQPQAVTGCGDNRTYAHNPELGTTQVSQLMQVDVNHLECRMSSAALPFLLLHIHAAEQTVDNVFQFYLDNRGL